MVGLQSAYFGRGMGVKPTALIFRIEERVMAAKNRSMKRPHNLHRAVPSSFAAYRGCPTPTTKE
jgi:hypothetical protein